MKLGLGIIFTTLNFVSVTVLASAFCGRVAVDFSESYFITIENACPDGDKRVESNIFINNALVKSSAVLSNINCVYTPPNAEKIEKVRCLGRANLMFPKNCTLTTADGFTCDGLDIVDFSYKSAEFDWNFSRDKKLPDPEWLGLVSLQQTMPGAAINILNLPTLPDNSSIDSSEIDFLPNLENKTYCRPMVGQGPLARPPKTKHCLSFTATKVTDNAETFFGNPAVTVDYELSEYTLSFDRSVYTLSKDYKTLTTVFGSTAVGTVFTLE